MNVLDRDTQTAVLRALVEGNSMRSTSRITGVARNTIANLLRDVGAHCINHHDRFVTGLKPKFVQLDEIWSFCYAKEKNVAPEQKGTGPGDVWTWVAIDPESKLVISYKSGSRDARTGQKFVDDLADRLAARTQITSDGHPVYERCIENAFGWNGTDYARLVKIFGPAATGDAQRRYSPPRFIKAEKHVVMGKPEKSAICTSHVERQNLTMRMSMRRFTRLTNAFSKKLDFHRFAIALHYTYYNFCRVHQTLSKWEGKPTTPAMMAGLASKPWTLGDILDLLHSK